MGLIEYIRQLIDVEIPKAIAGGELAESKAAEASTTLTTILQRLEEIEALTVENREIRAALTPLVDEANGFMLIASQKAQEAADSAETVILYKGQTENLRNETIALRDQVLLIEESLRTVRDESFEARNVAILEAQKARIDADRAAESETNAEESLDATIVVANDIISRLSSADDVLRLAEVLKEQIQNVLPGFSGIFLTDKPAHPSTDDEGGALIEGTYYHNTATDKVYRYNGFAWKPYLFTPLDAMYLGGQTKAEIIASMRSTILAELDVLIDTAIQDSNSSNLKIVEEETDMTMYDFNQVTTGTETKAEETMLASVDRSTVSIRGKISVEFPEQTLEAGGNLVFNVYGKAVQEGITEYPIATTLLTSDLFLLTDKGTRVAKVDSTLSAHGNINLLLLEDSSTEDYSLIRGYILSYSIELVRI